MKMDSPNELSGHLFDKLGDPSSCNAALTQTLNNVFTRIIVEEIVCVPSIVLPNEILADDVKTLS